MYSAVTKTDSVQLCSSTSMLHQYIQLPGSSLALHFGLVPSAVSVSHGDRTQHTGERSNANTFLGAALLLRCSGRELSAAAKNGGKVGRATGFAN